MAHVGNVAVSVSQSGLLTSDQAPSAAQDQPLGTFFRTTDSVNVLQVGSVSRLLMGFHSILGCL